MYGSGMAGAAVGLGGARPMPGKTGLSRKLRFALVTRAGFRCRGLTGSAVTAGEHGLPAGSRSADWSPATGHSDTMNPHSSYWAPCTWMYWSRLETTSAGDLTTYVTQRRRLDRPKALLLLQCMTICSLIFFLLGFETHQSKEDAMKLC